MSEIDMSAMQLLMVHADDQEPVLEDGLPDDCAGDERVEVEATTPEHLWDEGGDPNDLTLQRWGVIAPEGPEGDKLIGAVGELIKRRCEQQDVPEIVPYRVPSRMTEPEASVWQKSVFDNGSVPVEDLPRYLMILGDLDQVSLELQKVMSVDAFVGRLAFDREQDYAAYAHKVLAWEDRPADVPRGRSMFFTVHDGTPATHVGYQALVGPGMEMVKQRHEMGKFPAEQVLEVGDRWDHAPEDLLGQVGDCPPSMLFTLSHGLGAPRGGWDSEEQRRRRQGAMSFGRDGALAGEDLAERPFLPGGMWFMLACYGAGTPGASAYYHWLARLKDQGQFPGKLDFLLSGLPKDERPFIAAVPKAVLSNPAGPLAFMGHVDLAFSYSFQELDQGGTANRPARYMSILRSSLKRDRAGISFRELYRYLARTNTELTGLIDEDERAGAGASQDPARLASRSHLWMLRQDLSAYVLLGDPAARLQLQEGRAATATAAPAATDVAAMLGLGSGAAPAAPAAQAPPAPAEEALDVDIEELEEFIGELMTGERGAKAIARDAGLEASKLRQVMDVYRAGGRAALKERGLIR